MNAVTTNPAAATRAWLALVILTLASLGLGEWFPAATWLPLLVAAIIWAKGCLVARCFVEAHVAHPFIARGLRGFIAFAPVALVATAYFGDHLARWTALGLR